MLSIQTVLLLQECADAGWWMGEIGGRQGVFPDNFVKLLEVEKEVIVTSLKQKKLNCEKAFLKIYPNISMFF